MAGFETVVRPMILPNIRPAAARPVPFADDPAQGKCVISGQGAATITNSYNDSVSIQRASAAEQKRTFDEVRIKPKKGSGGATRGAREGEDDSGPYIDVEVVSKVYLKGSDGKKFVRKYAKIEESENVKIMRTNITRQKSAE